MRRTVIAADEDKSNNFTNKSEYNFDDLDLLNFRVSGLSTDITSKSDKSNRKKKQTTTFDGHDCPPISKYQHHQYKSASGDYPDLELLNPRRPNRKPPMTKIDAEKDTYSKKLSLLYSKQYPNSKTVSEETGAISKDTFRRKAKVCTVDVHTGFPVEMEQHQSSRKEAAVKQKELKENGTFPFKVTPSGNFKVNSQQVVFESQKLSVLVADPQNTKVNIRDNMSEPGEYHRRSVVDSLIGPDYASNSLGSIIANTAPIRKDKESSEYEGRITDQILDPELTLSRLGYTASEPIDWRSFKLPEKANLYLELHQRITNYTNADCKVYIDNEQFNCHLIVLQCYSEIFDEYVAVKKVELPSDKIGINTFAFIYDWMISGESPYTEFTRETILDILNAAKYLKIKDLIDQCWAFILDEDVFGEDTAFILYSNAKNKDLEDVRELMLPRIRKFFLTLVSSQDWLDLDKEDVINFLSSNYVCVNCEMEIFMSAIRWLRYKWQERQECTLDVMKYVRFGNIAPWQLIEIKRNPENPDFLKLMSSPEICKMIDDGLAFVIIKYWYGHENDDLKHWNNMLALEEPPARNWSGLDKTYFTYREFLIYLDQYRRKQLREKSNPKEKKQQYSCDAELVSFPKENNEKIAEPKIPTMDEFLLTRKGVGGRKQ